MNQVIKLYELAPSPTSTRYYSPTTWKTRMGLLHKNVGFETVPINFLDLRGDLAIRSGQTNITVPAIELPDGTFIYDSFRIAEWLEDNYLEAPSLFTGDGKPSRDAHPEHVATGKNYARLIDLGLGASKSEWAVWYDLFFPQLDQQIIGEEQRIYFTSDSRLGPHGYQKLLALDRQELTRRAKMNVQPLVEFLREHPNQYFQGTHPGQVDYIIFGRYAYCRMLDPVLTKEIWNEQGEELSNWIRKLSQAYNGHAQHLFDNL
ncbi:unnamed protein product [Rotaria magnacalcarata]|uniref:GST N-terminal domain-containing protein n=2 Tax=Rotaria magnacalcarata TaxID=392030 RepID=A0A816Q9Y0_9BILA|nr:unnamed protein product [Rotaria magnacalcarata]CAF4156407.1 unnamed protein product [Rotaria magnacalcarata]